MTSLAEQRSIRLRYDHTEMCNIRGPIIEWTAVSGSEPNVDKYELTIKINTIIGPGPSYRDKHRLIVTLPSSYPHQAAPVVQMITEPYPYHPNWFSAGPRTGQWCHGTWLISEGLGRFVIRMIRTLQYDLEITNEDSPANQDANQWYIANKKSGLFPCDRQVLPDPTGRRPARKFQIGVDTATQRPRFRIND